MLSELSKKDIVKIIDKEDPFILDIGSYDGSDAMEIKNLLPKAEIWCFESDERSVKLFEKRTKGLKLINKAVGNIDGIVSFYPSTSKTRRHYVNSDWSASSSLNPPEYHLELFEDVKFKDPIEVRCVRLDSVIDRNVDFIWCDINGAEKEFIEGALETLKKTRYLYIEFSDKKLYKNQITKDEILSFLPDFRLIDVYNFKGNFGNLLLKNDNL